MKKFSYLLMILGAFTLVLAACGKEDNEEEHAHAEHEESGHDHGDHEHGFHTEGFDMEFTELDDVKAWEESKLEVKITLDDTDLEDARVRYEIWKEDDKDNTDWVNADEVNPGNYIADYVFDEAATYTVRVHVEGEDELHEHKEYEVEVK